MRLIDLDSLISNLEKMESYNCSPMYRRGYDDCISTIKRQTIVDAVEVVRCKDCRHWDEETGWCNQNSAFDDHDMDWNIYNDCDFCSYGERRTDCFNET